MFYVGLRLVYGCNNCHCVRKCIYCCRAGILLAHNSNICPYELISCRCFAGNSLICDRACASIVILIIPKIPSPHVPPCWHVREKPWQAIWMFWELPLLLQDEIPAESSTMAVPIKSKALFSLSCDLSGLK